MYVVILSNAFDHLAAEIENLENQLGAVIDEEWDSQMNIRGFEIDPAQHQVGPLKCSSVTERGTNEPLWLVGCGSLWSANFWDSCRNIWTLFINLNRRLPNRPRFSVSWAESPSYHSSHRLASNKRGRKSRFK